jgi:hypothetical protein
MKPVLLLLLVIFSFYSLAEIKISIFKDKQLTLPSHCYFNVREDASEFWCPSEFDKIRSVSFHSLDYVEKGHIDLNAVVKEFNLESTDLGNNMYLLNPIKQKMVGYTHYLSNLTVNNSPYYSYDVCSDRNCLRVRANDKVFIENLLLQIVTNTLFSE